MNRQREKNGNFFHRTIWATRPQHSTKLDIPHFSKPRGKFIEQMIYGIQASQDTKLSSIGRALGEQIALKKTEERLSRHLAVEGLGRKINEMVVKHGARKVHKDTLARLHARIYAQAPSTGDFIAEK